MLAGSIAAPCCLFSRIPAMWRPQPGWSPMMHALEYFFVLVHRTLRLSCWDMRAMVTSRLCLVAYMADEARRARALPRGCQAASQQEELRFPSDQRHWTSSLVMIGFRRSLEKGLVKSLTQFNLSYLSFCVKFWEFFIDCEHKSFTDAWFESFSSSL